MANPSAFPAHPTRPTHQVEYVSVQPICAVRCHCTLKGTTIMIMHLYQPGICPHCQAQYWVASLTHDKPSWQKAEQDAGRDAQNINECPVSVMISRIEPTIVMPPGARH